MKANKFGQKVRKYTYSSQCKEHELIINMIKKMQLCQLGEPLVALGGGEKKFNRAFQNKILADLKGFGRWWIWKTVERHDEEDGRSSRPIQWLSLYLEELSSQIISALLIGRQSRAVALPAQTQPSDWSRERKSATEADVHLSQLCDSDV